MLDKYQNVGWKKFYLIYGMCDETFSVNCTTEVPEGVDKGWFMFFVTLLNQIYWVGGATAGALLGTMVTRFLPFLIFPEGKEPPEFIQYLGKVLHYAVIGLLVIYCLKDVPGSGTYGIPEFWRLHLSYSFTDGKRAYCSVSAVELYFICCWCSLSFASNTIKVR